MMCLPTINSLRYFVRELNGRAQSSLLRQCSCLLCPELVIVIVFIGENVQTLTYSKLLITVIFMTTNDCISYHCPTTATRCLFDPSLLCHLYSTILSDAVSLSLNL